MRRPTPVMALANCLIVLLAACEQPAMPEEPEASDITAAEVADEDRYRTKVRKKVSASVVSSFAREWGVPEAKVECLYEKIDVTKFEDADSDPAVAAAFEQCGLEVAP